MEAKKIIAGDYCFREDLVREADYLPAEDQSGKLLKDKDREVSKLVIYFLDGEVTTLNGNEAEIAWRKYIEDAR